MKRLLMGMVLVAILGGCATQEKCQRKFPPKEFVIVKDSIVRDTVERMVPVEVIVYDTIMGDTVRETVEIQGKVKNDFSKLESNFSISKAWVRMGQLHHELITKSQIRSWKQETWAEAKDFYERYYRTHQKTIVQEKRVNYVTQWQILQMWGGRVFGVLLLMFVIGFFLRSKLGILRRLL